MKCKDCGKENPDYVIHCIGCGNSLQEIQQRPEHTPAKPVFRCSQCGSILPEGETHCQHCNPKPKEKENIIAGFGGALIGALIGGGCIVLFSQLGFVAALSGVVLSAGTLMGYKLLGGKLSTTGVVICLILMSITPYFADRISLAIEIVQELGEYGISFKEAYALVPEFLAEGIIDEVTYVMNLLMVYGFTAIGGFSILRNWFLK